MEFRILGPLELYDHGHQVEVSRAKPRALLAMLLLHPNETVARDRLIHAVWDGRPPASAVNTLQTHVSYLRKCLPTPSEDAEAGVSLQTQSAGYSLIVGPDQIDSFRFEALVARARQSARAGDPAAAVETFRSALSLWRGGALAGFADRAFAAGAAARLEELHVAACEELIDAELVRGHHHEIVGELTELVSHHPLRERLSGQLMLALYRTGRQVDALRAYESARRRLVEQIGVGPGPALQRMEREILKQAPTLDWREERRPASDGVVRMAGVNGRGSRPLLPPALGLACSSPMAGRAAELEHLLEQWNRATGEVELALISGEPGIGKTRLAAEFGSAVYDLGGTVLYGRSDEELEVPYRPFAEALQYLAAHLGPSESTQAVAHGDLRRLVPGFPDLPGDDAGAERLRLFAATSDWLRTTGEHGAPVLLILDDLQWADRSTLQLMRHLVTDRAAGRLMVTATYRDTDLGSAHPLTSMLGDLRRIGHTDRIHLAGLDEVAIQGLLGDRLRAGAGGSRAQRLARVLRERTDGNPFFIGELIAQLGHLDVGDADVDVSERLGVPEGVREVVRKRLSTLAPEVEQLLCSAATAGSEFTADLLGALLTTDPGWIVEQLEAALAAGLIIELKGEFASYRLTHALVRQALEEEYSATKRVLMHDRVARELEARHAPYAELAYHFTRAAPKAGHEKAMRFNGLAAQEAAERLAPEQVVEFLQVALQSESQLPPEPTRRAQLLLELGEAKNACGLVVEARDEFVQAAALARNAGDAGLLARGAIGYGGVFGVWVDFGETTGRDLVDEALAALAPEDSVPRVLCLAKLSGWLTPSPDATDRLRLTADAMAMAARLDDPEARIPALSARISALRGQPGGAAEQLPLSRELKQLARASRRSVAVAESLFHGVVAGLVLADTRPARVLLTELGELGEQTGLGMARWGAAAVDTTLAITDGRFDLLPALNERERELGTAVGYAGPLSADAHLMVAAMLREDWLEYARICGFMLEAYAQSVRGTGVPVMVAWALGDSARARSELAAWSREHRPYVPAEFLSTTAASLARAAADLGMADEVKVLYNVLEPHSGTWCTIGTGPDFGMADHSLALLSAALGDGRGAASYIRSAIDVYRREGARAWLAVGLADLAALADQPGERAAASAEACSIAAAIGAEGVGRRARAALRVT